MIRLRRAPAPTMKAVPVKPMVQSDGLDGSQIQLWYATLRKRSWTSLVVAPAHPGGSTYEIANALAEAGLICERRAVKLIDAREAPLGEASAVISEMVNHAVSRGRVIAAVGSVLTNQVGIPIATAADAVLLCVEMGRTDLASARRTIELIGAEKIIGCVTVAAEKK